MRINELGWGLLGAHFGADFYRQHFLDCVEALDLELGGRHSGGNLLHLVLQINAVGQAGPRAGTHGSAVLLVGCSEGRR